MAGKQTNHRANPNHIPAEERTVNMILSAILFAYGTIGLINDDLYIPGRRGPGIHLHGEPAWVMYAAFLCAVANLMSVVVDHYDRRDNEINYKVFARVSRIFGWIIFGAALIVEIVYQKAD